MNWFESRFTLEPADRICMIALAMDYEELEHYSRYIAAGGKPSKFKWSSPDKAGTNPIGKDGMTEGMNRFFDKIGAKKIKRGRGGAERIASVQGRPVAYIMPDQTVWIKSGDERAMQTEMSPLDVMGAGYVPYGVMPDEESQFRKELGIGDP